MFDTLGERKEKRRYIRNRVIPFSTCCLFLIGCIIYLFSLDSEDSSKPTDVVQGTGHTIENFEMTATTPEGLQVKWDEVFGQAWSIAYVSGWIRNTSSRTVNIQNVAYRVLDENNNTIWEDTDYRFSGGFGLEPVEYFDFYVMPVCNRPATVFEIVVE